jgi:PEP-CTERM motif
MTIMNIRGLFVVIAVLLTLAVPSAHAITWDFGTLAENTFPNPPNTGEGPYPAAGIAMGEPGFIATLFAGASNSGTDETSVAYMDGYSSGRPAGLGVCSAGTTSGSTGRECDIASDDNLGLTPVGFVETLNIWFDRRIDLLKLTFRDDNHFLSPAGDRVSISVNGGTAVTYTIGAGGVIDLAGLAGTTFDFVALDGAVYIEKLTAVPEPAIVMLMGLGLLGLRFARRKAS